MSLPRPATRTSPILLTLLLLLLLTLSPTTARRTCRRVVPINPPTLFDAAPFSFTQLTIDTQTRVAHFAGQVAIDVNATIVGTTLEQQLAQVETNLRAAMQFVDAENNDILFVRAFIVQFDPVPDLPLYQALVARFGSPAGTVVGVTSLALEGLLVEIEMDVAVSRPVAMRFRCMAD
eukprot:GFKZ01008159.1.p1 GENE.GFKZ01008159.1~~GFKZ01008159.1.p1  ORF type:complete len:189 (+),score=28.40 GFKZ01008159.1:39-569(+)